MRLTQADRNAIAEEMFAKAKRSDAVNHMSEAYAGEIYADWTHY